jgi:hypothetical protein
MNRSFSFFSLFSVLVTITLVNTGCTVHVIRYDDPGHVAIMRLAYHDYSLDSCTSNIVYDREYIHDSRSYYGIIRYDYRNERGEIIHVHARHDSVGKIAGIQITGYDSHGSVRHDYTERDHEAIRGVTGKLITERIKTHNK